MPRAINQKAKVLYVMRLLLQSGERNLSKEVILARVWGWSRQQQRCRHLAGSGKFRRQR